MKVIKWIRSDRYFTEKGRESNSPLVSGGYYLAVGKFCADHNTKIAYEDSRVLMTNTEEEFIMIRLMEPEAVECILP